jgi:hypothetical protein
MVKMSSAHIRQLKNAKKPEAYLRQAESCVLRGIRAQSQPMSHWKCLKWVDIPSMIHALFIANGCKWFLTVEMGAFLVHFSSDVMTLKRKHGCQTLDMT